MRLNIDARNIRTLSLKVSACLAATGAAGLGVAGVLDAGPASASSVSQRPVAFACTFPIFGRYIINGTLSWVQPNSVMVGERLPEIALSVTVPVSASVVQTGHAAGVESIEATVTESSVIMAPQGNRSVQVVLTMPRESASGTGTAYAVLSGHLPSQTFTRPGIAEVTLGQAALQITPRYGNGSPTWLGTVSVTCTPAAGQSDVVTTFRINPRQAAGPAPLPRTTPSPVHASAATPAPRPTSAKPEPTSPSPVASSPARVKSGPRALGLAAYSGLAAGSGLALAVAGAGAAWLVRRGKPIRQD